jgi:ArsR family transcriptional regulator, arsenate/arsenite/antimonite-responsive transcriptional repressor
MDTSTAAQVLSALSHPTRIEAFRALVKSEPDGLAAGEIARRGAVPHNTMSAHLATLERVGLIAGERRSRSIIYRVSFDRIREVMLFLLKDCCSGKAEICTPLVADLVPFCLKEKSCHA